MQQPQWINRNMLHKILFWQHVCWKWINKEKLSIHLCTICYVGLSHVNLCSHSSVCTFQQVIVVSHKSTQCPCTAHQITKIGVFHTPSCINHTSHCDAKPFILLFMYLQSSNIRKHGSICHLLFRAQKAWAGELEK